MDSNIKGAIIAAVAAIVGAGISAYATILVSQKTLKETTSGLIRRVYDNGSVTEAGFTGGRMVVKVNGSSTGPQSTPIDMIKFSEMCGDVDGCSLTMGATRFRVVGKGGEPLVAPLIGSPCRFFYNETKHWSLSQSCVAIYGLYAYQGTWPDGRYEFSHAYQVYEYSNAYGVDDSLQNGTDPDRQPLIVMGFKGACYLAESAPDTKKGGGNFLPDDASQIGTGRGLHLVASSPGWEFLGLTRRMRLAGVNYGLPTTPTANAS